jgi:hypothetical protein
MNRAKVASNLVKMTWLRDHPALATTDLDINQIDWKTIDSFEWDRSQKVLVEVLRFINCGESLIRLSEINMLTEDEKRIVALSLHMLYNDLGLEENLV